MNTEELKLICAMTVKLVELRQNECKHLSIENVSPEIFKSLLAVYDGIPSEPYVALPIDGHVWAAIVDYTLAHKDDIENDINDFGYLRPVLEYFYREDVSTASKLQSVSDDLLAGKSLPRG